MYKVPQVSLIRGACSIMYASDCERFNQKLWSSGMDDIKRHNFNFSEALAGRHLHEIVLSHRDLTPRMPRPLPDCRHYILHEDLRVPMIGLEKEQLPPGFQQAVENAEVLREGTVTKYSGANDVIETLGSELRREILDQDRIDVG